MGPKMMLMLKIYTLGAIFFLINQDVLDFFASRKSLVSISQPILDSLDLRVSTVFKIIFIIPPTQKWHPSTYKALNSQCRSLIRSLFGRIKTSWADDVDELGM